MIFLYIVIFLVTAVFGLAALLQVLVGVFFVIIGKVFKSNMWFKYGMGLLIGVDQNVNTFWFGFPDETISSRTGRAMHMHRPKWFVRNLLCPFIDGVFQLLGDRDHTFNAIEVDRKFCDKPEIWSWHTKKDQKDKENA